MSFKKFSESQAAPGNDKPVGQTKASPTGGDEKSLPTKKQDEAAPAQKS
jgi:hypothetical protein